MSLMTGFHLDIDLLTILWLWPPNRFFIWIFHPSNPFLSNFKIKIYCGPQRSPGRWHQLLLTLMMPLHHRRPLVLSGTICPWWSHAGCLRLPPHLAFALTKSFQNDLLHELPRHRCEAYWPVVSWVFLSPFLKTGSDVSLFPVTGKFIWQPWLLKYIGEWFGNKISQLLQDLGMHTIWPHKPVYIQLHEAVLDLLYHNGRDFAPTTPA